MTTLLLRQCRLLVSMDDSGTEIRDAYLAAENGWITSVSASRPPGEFDREIDCSKFLAIPGLVNTHHHLYQTLTRGFPESAGQGLFSWLQSLYPIWAGLDAEMIETSTLTGLAELALSGCTTTSDHLYVFPAGSEEFMDVQIAAGRKIGVRFHPTRGSMDLGEADGGLPPTSVVQKRIDILRDCERVVDTYHDPSPGAMTRIGLAPCSPFSATAELMLESAGLARELGVRLHTHIAETNDEDAYSRSKFGVGPIALLERLGWMAEDVWLAHCVHLSDADIGLMAQSHTAVAHCPTSNMLLGSGLARIRELLRAGVSVGLGVDGSASNDSGDIRQEVKQAVLAARVRDGATALSVRGALQIATRGGADCLGRDDLGSLETGKVADIALFDLDTLACAGGGKDPVAAVFLGSTRPHTVIVHGKPIVEKYELLAADTQRLAADQRSSSERLLLASQT